MLHPSEWSEQSGWTESSLESAGQNSDRRQLEWWPDHRAGVHWSISGLSKDTVPGLDKVKYSDIKNLSEDDKSELFTLYKESFAMGLVSEDRSQLTQAYP